MAAACGSAERTCSLEDFRQFACFLRPVGEVLPSPPKPTDAALIVFTSGTTGAAKAVVQSHYSIAQNAFSLAEHHDVKPYLQFLCVLPLYHVNGLEFTIFSVMLGGPHFYRSSVRRFAVLERCARARNPNCKPYTEPTR
jgi:long-subunit acyl-CoA synthetase (AMP-forming)